MTQQRVLVVGGTGGFGRRLVEGLVATTGLDVVIGARNLDQLKDSLGSRVDVVLADAAGLDAAEAVLADIVTGPPRRDAGERRLTAPVAAGAVTLPELVRRLDAAGVMAEDVSVRRPTLDEVFLDRTRAAEGYPA